MELIFLGTASCYPTTDRSVSCTLLRFEDGRIWMFDCGEGSQVQLQKSSAKPGRIEKIFITHLHGDHVHELMIAQHQYPDDWHDWKVDNDDNGCLHPQEIGGRSIVCDDSGVWEVFSEQSATVLAGAALHSIPSFGFVVTEADSPGRLDVEKLKQLGVPPGPLYGRIKAGHSVKIHGNTIEPSSVLGPKKKGRKVTIVGDTCDASRMKKIAQNSDVVVHEATLEEALRDKALENGHSTPAMAAQFAKDIGARVLILYHYSQRYRQTADDAEGDMDSVAKLLAEAEAALSDCDSCSVVASGDLMEIPVKRRE
ncbi:zinc phosphodiesterase ELAC protein 1-like isoform X2 [Schistocerca serialis cubense]|uniref:zinc phosphodiesterase ELAC protein 1-like isoform X2 n=1 Tax=Schistocerca serialis cubense TaxID=2023355 RepID=UPI00214E6C55|nr:zinc phosphodiesterase ELAC protein 1-like isoform X2 [Schistocerca serialis cubense]